MTGPWCMHSSKTSSWMSLSQPGSFSEVGSNMLLSMIQVEMAGMLGTLTWGNCGTVRPVRRENSLVHTTLIKAIQHQPNKNNNTSPPFFLIECIAPNIHHSVGLFLGSLSPKGGGGGGGGKLWTLACHHSCGKRRTLHSCGKRCTSYCNKSVTCRSKYHSSFSRHPQLYCDPRHFLRANLDRSLYKPVIP